jgi:HSP20 family protein
MPAVHKRIDRLFDDPFFRVGHMVEGADPGLWNPAVDLYEKDDQYVIKAELPGVDKDDIKVDLKDHLLTLSGERTYDSEVKEENYYRRERSYGKFRRSFSLPTDVDSDKITAEFKDGVLRVEVPKPEAQKPKQVTIH